MTPQTFRGSSLEAAKQSATQALGPSAIVLASRRLRKTGLSGLFGGSEFEVTATSPDVLSPPRPTRTAFADAARFSAPPNVEAEQLRNEVRSEIRALRAVLASTRAEPAASGTATFSDALARELEELREMVAELGAARDPNGKKKKRLAAIGLEGSAERTANRRLKHVEGEPSDEELRAAIGSLVDVAEWPIAADGRTLIALVGPTGVGKTTTAAKLAARAIIDHDKTVTLITTDSYRVGAREQMARFADLLGAELVVVNDRPALAAAIDKSTSDVIIVDTAGRGPTEPDGVETALARLKTKAAFKRHTLLCLPAALRELDARALAKFFAPCKPTALAITKIDETSSPVGLVHATSATKLGVSVICFGQRVPEDIAHATPERVLDAVMGAGESAAPAPARA
jgi:flagellar biosynthesis protein FlhF